VQCEQSTCDYLEGPVKIGEPFNPHRRFNGVFVPLGLLRCRDIGDGAKLLYGRLCLFAGKDGECFADRTELAKEMGLSVASIGRQLEELVEAKFIRRVRRGRGQTALCRFLWHPALECCERVTSDSAKVRRQEPSEGAKVSHQEEIQIAQECAPDSAILRHAIKEEKIPLKDSLTPAAEVNQEPEPEPQPKPKAKMAGVRVLTSLEGKIANVAREIHDRHPAVRRCGPAEVRKLLKSIAGRARSPDRLALLDTVNENHRLWCASYQWTKDGGEFAKGLDNWLAPTMERYLTQPGQASAALTPATEYQSAEEYLRRVENE